MNLLSSTLELLPGTRGFAGVYRGLSKAYRKLGKFEKAAGVLRRGMVQYPRSSGLHIECANLYASQGKWAEAKEILEKVLLVIGDDAPAELYWQLGRVLRRHGDLNASEALVRKGLERDPGNQDLMIEEAGVASARGDWGEAAKRWDSLLGSADENVPIRVYRELVRAYRKTGQYDRAEAVIGKAPERFLSDRGLAREAAEVATLRGDWGEAAKRWGCLLGSADENVPIRVYRELVRAYRKAGQYDGAEAVIGKAPERFLLDRGLALEAAKIATLRGDWTAAALRWERACKETQRDGQLTDTLRKLAVAYQRMGEPDRAKPVFERLLTQAKPVTRKAQNDKARDAIVGTCFILFHSHGGWILEKIARVIADNLDTTHTFFYLPTLTIPDHIPRARNYFFMHYQMACHAMLKRKDMWDASLFCWFTHPDMRAPVHPDILPVFLNELNTTFLPNSDALEMISKNGGDRSRLSVVIGGADPNVFQGHDRGRGKIGFVGGYYERKNPQALIELAKAMPAEQFLILGPREIDIANKSIYWPNSPIFEKIVAQSNIEYREAPYDEFPAHISEVDVFLMLSSLEGGPIPLLEAMMANCMPVSTNTGFARDLIRNGENGYLVDTKFEIDEIVEKITKARQNKNSVRETVVDHTWRKFGQSIARKIS